MVRTLRQTARAALLGALLCSLPAPPAQAAGGDTPPPDALDGLPRTLPGGGRLPCETETPLLVRYEGKHLRYQKPVRVHPLFGARLPAFEQIVSQLAMQHYGRLPKRIVHLGAYSCRRMRRYPSWVSEHALGNAIDIAGFDFGPEPRKQSLPAQLPAALRRAFEVRLERHWNAAGVSAVHSAFLRELARALIARPDLFSVVLGPSWPGHHNHFHLDHAPYRVVQVF